MRDDEEYWDALSGRIMARVRKQRRSAWLGVSVWAPPLAAAAALTLLIARSGSTPTAERRPSVATMLTSEVQPPSVAALLGQEP